MPNGSPRAEVYLEEKMHTAKITPKFARIAHRRCRDAAGAHSVRTPQNLQSHPKLGKTGCFFNIHKLRTVGCGLPDASAEGLALASGPNEFVPACEGGPDSPKCYRLGSILPTVRPGSRTLRLGGVDVSMVHPYYHVTLKIAHFLADGSAAGP